MSIAGGRSPGRAADRYQDFNKAIVLQMMQRWRYTEPEIVGGLARKPSGARSVFRVVTVVTLTSFALHIEPLSAASTCANLSYLSLPRTTVTLARSYQAGEMVSGVTK